MRSARKGVDDRQDAKFPASRQLIMQGVHRSGLIRPCRRTAIVAQLCSRHFVAQLQAELAVDPPSSCNYPPAFTAHQHVNAPIAVGGLALPLSPPPIRSNASTARSTPRPSVSSLTRPPSFAWSAPSCWSRTTNGPRKAPLTELQNPGSVEQLSDRRVAPPW